MLNIEDDTSSTSSTTPSMTDTTIKGENGHAHQVHSIYWSYIPLNINLPAQLKYMYYGKCSKISSDPV